MGNKTEETLLQQHRIDEFEIERRKALFGFGATDAAALLQARSCVLPALDAVVEAFYRQQTANEEIALIIGDSETMRRLHLAQRQYIDDLFSGIYDENYVNNRLRIGVVHKRIGVAPKYYLSAVGTLRRLSREQSIRTSPMQRMPRRQGQRSQSSSSSTPHWCSTPTSEA